MPNFLLLANLHLSFESYLGNVDISLSRRLSLKPGVLSCPFISVSVCITPYCNFQMPNYVPGIRVLSGFLFKLLDRFRPNTEKLTLGPKAKKGFFLVGWDFERHLTSPKSGVGIFSKIIDSCLFCFNLRRKLQAFSWEKLPRSFKNVINISRK